jgi:hypothetical protein
MNNKSVWETLSKIDVSEHIDKKGRLSYLSWAWAWGTLMKYYPQAKYNFLQTEKHEDGTVTVYCEVIIDDLSRLMWLPVMDHKNNAIVNPDARKISDTKMRCLTKCLAMFGLGHYIYAGEDLPEQEPQPLVSEERLEEILEILRSEQHLKFYDEVFELTEEEQQFVFSNLPKGMKTAIKDNWRKSIKLAVASLDDLADEIKEAILNEDDLKIKEELEDLGKHSKKYIWKMFSPDEQYKIRDILKGG